MMAFLVAYLGEVHQSLEIQVFHVGSVASNGNP